MLFATSVILPSCKKGVDDPFFTFRSRDQRLCQKWKLTGIAGTTVNGTLTTTYSFSGTILTASISGGVSNSASGTFEMTISKKGQVSWSETYTPTGGSTDTQSGQGHWSWLSSNRSRDYINIDGDGSGFLKLFGGGIYYIDKLAEKQMIFKYSDESDDNGNVISHDFTYAFTKE